MNAVEMDIFVWSGSTCARSKFKANATMSECNLCVALFFGLPGVCLTQCSWHFIQINWIEWNRWVDRWIERNSDKIRTRANAFLFVGNFILLTSVVLTKEKNSECLTSMQKYFQLERLFSSVSLFYDCITSTIIFTIKVSIFFLYFYFDLFFFLPVYLLTHWIVK